MPNVDVSGNKYTIKNDTFAIADEDEYLSRKVTKENLKLVLRILWRQNIDLL